MGEQPYLPMDDDEREAIVALARVSGAVASWTLLRMNATVDALRERVNALYDKAKGALDDLARISLVLDGETLDRSNLDEATMERVRVSMLRRAGEWPHETVAALRDRAEAAEGEVERLRAEVESHSLNHDTAMDLLDEARAEVERLRGLLLGAYGHAAQIARGHDDRIGMTIGGKIEAAGRAALRGEEEA